MLQLSLLIKGPGINGENAIFIFSREVHFFLRFCVASKNSQLHCFHLFLLQIFQESGGGWGLSVLGDKGGCLCQYWFCTWELWTIWCKQYKFSMATSQTRFVSRTYLFFNIYHFRGGLFLHFFSVTSCWSTGGNQKWHFAQKITQLYKHNIGFTSILFSLVQLKIFLKDIFTRQLYIIWVVLELEYFFVNFFCLFLN